METRGRPTVMTPEIIDKLRQAFLFGASDEEACTWAGIGKSTLYDYQQLNPDFVEQKEGWKTNPIIKAKKLVSDAIDRNDKDTAKWYLERKRKSEFSLRHEVTGEDGDPLKFTLEIKEIKE